LLATSAVATAKILPNETGAATNSTNLTNVGEQTEGKSTPVDFRYAPRVRQTAFCFPDDPDKSLTDEAGTLLYGYDSKHGIDRFPLKVGFGLNGMNPAQSVEQRLEEPGIPILTTKLNWDDVTLTLATFATNRAGEGRYDNVVIQVRGNSDKDVEVEPVLSVNSQNKWKLEQKDDVACVSSEGTQEPLLYARIKNGGSETGIKGTPRLFSLGEDEVTHVVMHAGRVSRTKTYEAFVRLPQAGSLSGAPRDMQHPEDCLAAARAFWKEWRAFHDPVSWKLGGRQGEFLTACARNILQAREVHEGKLTFQVGPTCYRGLWVVDGNFILEAARYLGYDKEAVEGLHTTWSKQQENGQVLAGGGAEHWKDTAIAMFTLVRQCELSQDWSAAHELEAQVVRAIEFIDGLRTRARTEGSVLGRYGLLARGFADGGIDGAREELTNTVWTLAGLKAVDKCGVKSGIASFAKAGRIYHELYDAFMAAAREQMRVYPEGNFSYLPMLLKEDSAWSVSDEWERPRPQSAQWALSHAIFPGRILEATHPIVRGHAALMQAVTQEEIPAETGWIHHGGTWNYNAAFVAEVYLWMGLAQAARKTFIGFLNHASPQFCWREEQPLQESHLSTYIGDMPHNWASAECIRYLRHMLALEDGDSLRLLEGVAEQDLRAQESIQLKGTPTRFGRVNLALEPLDARSGWRVEFNRAKGESPGRITLPARLGATVDFTKLEGAEFHLDGKTIIVNSQAQRWSAFWKR
jgi:hypothetical protein